MGLPPPSRSPRQRRFSFSSRLKRCGDAPRGRSGRRAGCFQVPGPGLASAGLRPARLQEHLPSCADSRIPEQGWGGPGPRALRPPLGTSVPAPPCHPGASPSPTPRVRLSPPHPPCCSQGWAPKPHLLPTRPLNLRPFPPTRPRTEARRILFSHCFHCVIPEFKNPLGSLLEQEDTPTTTTQSLGTHPPYPTCCLPFLRTFSPPPFWALPCFQNLLLRRQDLGTLHL